MVIDLLGLLLLGEFVLVIVDYFSRYYEVEIMCLIILEKVIECLEKIFIIYGLF